MVFTYVVHGSDIVTNNLLVGLAKRCHFLIKDRSTEIHDSLFYDDWRVTIKARSRTQGILRHFLQKPVRMFEKKLLCNEYNCSIHNKTKITINLLC